jgi:hypothetical protein
MALSRAGVLVGAFSLTVALGTTACTGSAADTAGSATGGAGADSTGLPPLRGDGLAFFDPTVLAGALLAPPPDDLEHGIDLSTAVILGTITDVRATRTLVGETENDQLDMLGVVVKPTEIIHGALATGLEEIVVEFATGGDRDTIITAMRSSLPTGAGVWFVREADIGQLRVIGSEVTTPAEPYYNVTDLRAGVLADGDGQVVTGPWRDEPAEPREQGEPVSPVLQSMKTHAESFATLQDLVTYLRTLG